MTKKARRKAPQLRFSEFNGDWKTDRSDHFLIRYVNPVEVQLDTQYEQIGIRSHGKGIFHKEPVTGRELGNKRVYWVHPEAFTVNIVFAWEQAVALTSNAEKGFIASHRFLMFLPKENRVDLKFILLFFLRKRGKSLLELASPGGAGRNKTLGQDNFAELQLTLPNKEEQEKIASFLGAVDTRLTQLRRKHKLLLTYKRGVMQKLFSQQIRFKCDDGKTFLDWEISSLKKIGIEISDGNYGESYPKQEEFKDSGIPFIRANNLKNGKIIWDDMKFIDIRLHEVLKSGHLIEKDILITTRGDIGIVALVNQEFQDSNINAQLCLLRNSDVCNQIFLFYFLLTAKAKKQFLELTTGSALKQLPRKNLLNLTIDYPSIPEQEKIANFLTVIDKKIEAVAKQIELTEQFKKGLLQKMFV